MTRCLEAIALVGAGDVASADPLQEQVIGDPLMNAQDRVAVERLMAQAWYDKAPPSQAVKWGRRYLADGGKDDLVHTIVTQSLYKAGDYAAAVDALKAAVAANEAAGMHPPEVRLQMLASSQSQLKNDAAYVVTLEQLVRLYPKKDYWNSLLANVERKPGFEDYVILDVYRLRLATGSMKEAEDFTDMANLALRGGYPAEAKSALDAGIAAGLLGHGKGGAEFDKLRLRADAQAEEDRKALGQGDARVEQAKDGTGLFANGFNYVTHGRFDQGVPMMERGIARGGLKHPDLARLELGVAYALAGKKEPARAVFAQVTGTDGAADLARLWNLYLDGQP